MVPAQFKNLPDNFHPFAPPLSEKWGTHHSKFILLGYETGMRVVILTCNNIMQDCELNIGIAAFMQMWKWLL